MYLRVFLFFWGGGLSLGPVQTVIIDLDNFFD